jgi:hypothetical protein
MISSGVLYDGQKLLEMVFKAEETAAGLLASFKKIAVADFPTVLDLSQNCRWVAVADPGHLVLTTRGQEIFKLGSAELQLRHQIADVLNWIKPSWSKKIADGRSEAFKLFPVDVQQVFKEAGLMDAWSDDLISWWDEVGIVARSKKQDANLKTGRKAERLSLVYEEERTGQKAEWKSLETNYAHYDILSIMAPGDARPCAIEVKGSTLRKNEAVFFLSRDEWEVANGKDTYRLHLWLIREGEQDRVRDLRVIDAMQLAAHIPEDKGEGEWTVARMPFEVFW